MVPSLSLMPKKIPYFDPYNTASQRKLDKYFYKSKDWRYVRAQHLESNPLCVDCLKTGILNCKSIEVHHIVNRKARPDLALEPTNLESLCKSHHSMRKA